MGRGKTALTRPADCWIKGDQYHEKGPKIRGRVYADTSQLPPISITRRQTRGRFATELPKMDPQDFVETTAEMVAVFSQACWSKRGSQQIPLLGKHIRHERRIRRCFSRAGELERNEWRTINISSVSCSLKAEANRRLQGTTVLEPTIVVRLEEPTNEISLSFP